MVMVCTPLVNHLEQDKRLAVAEVVVDAMDQSDAAVRNWLRLE
jgi:hypothetical protein